MNSSQLVYGQETVSDKVKKLCEGKYDYYKRNGVKTFSRNYSHLAYLSQCLSLFEDSNWDFKGKEKIDKYYEKYNQIESNTNHIIQNYDNQKPSIDIISTSRIGYEMYALKFRICADDSTITEPKIFVITDKEYFLAKANRTIKENSCNFGLVYMTSKDTSKTFVIPFDGNYSPSNYLKVKLFY